MDLVLNIIMIVIGGLLLSVMSYKMLQIFQLSSYRANGVLNWFKITKLDYILRYFALAFFSFMGMFCFLACFSFTSYLKYFGFIIFILFSILFIFLTRKQDKVALKHTARIIRFIIVNTILCIAASFGMMQLSKVIPMVSYSLLGVLPLFIPLISMVSHYILLPFETLNNYGYKMRAIKAINLMPHLIKIGITGSFGKTTCKNILAAMLEKKYKVCFSPQSYNTPMGISKVINNSLSEIDEVFIAEMGARNVGDIKELTCLVQPNFGIITAIGNQHLETFGSIENIISTKYELIENLVLGGVAAFNGDSPYTKDMFDRTQTEKIITGECEGAFVTYKNISSGGFGTRFDLIHNDKTVIVETKLLGRHIPSLIVLCAGIAIKLGVSLEDIAAACKTLEPVPHRLELIQNGDTTIIDDAYNSNTEGAKNALILLKSFTQKKFVITPGIVELGAEEKEANTQFGRDIADCADIALLVGTRGADIKDGAIENGMNEENIILTESLFEAVEKLKEFEGEKVVLFENDLPDNY